MGGCTTRERLCWVVVAGILIVIGTAGAAEQGAMPLPQPKEVAVGVQMIPGGIQTDRQPDGNSVVFEAPSGMVVVDTGWHACDRGAILALARSTDRKVVAVVKTHWHLDHASGNPPLRAAYPGLRVYATNAIDGALTGFLAKSAADAAGYLEDPSIPDPMREDVQSDVATIRNGAARKPDTVIAATGPMNMGGPELQVHLAADAATAGDVWLRDAKTRVTVLGDLVTLPAHFLDTACPDGWQAAPRDVTETNFELAIRGHGAPMNRGQSRPATARQNDATPANSATGRVLFLHGPDSGNHIPSAVCTRDCACAVRKNRHRGASLLPPGNQSCAVLRTAAGRGRPRAALRRRTPARRPSRSRAP
jgi:glyoxylase-like metal-dependent hydrolase (beta-lactamase superfamily II)